MSRHLRVIVVDDEPLARVGISMYIKDIEFLEMKGACDNAVSACRIISEGGVDLMFLDIHMPGLSGFELLKSLPNPPVTIVTTAFHNYALAGFEFDVLDFLVKPYTFERFLKAVNKASDFIQLRENASQRNFSSLPAFFFIKCDCRYEKIHFNEILYAQGMENYVTIHTKNRKYITQMTMKALEAILPAVQFMRIHKSYIVSLLAISGIKGNFIRIAGHKEIPVSRDRKSEIFSRLELK